jgi:hypothetical protein
LSVRSAAFCRDTIKLSGPRGGLGACNGMTVDGR